MRTQQNAKNLFKVELFSKIEKDTSFCLLDERMLESYLYYSSRYNILSVDPMGALWPEGVTVESAVCETPFRCYTRATYTIRSPKLLTEEDVDILRAQGCFMGGQVSGECNIDIFTREGDLYVYGAYSVCDSGD